MLELASTGAGSGLISELYLWLESLLVGIYSPCKCNANNRLGGAEYSDEPHGWSCSRNNCEGRELSGEFNGMDFFLSLSLYIYIYQRVQ